MNNITIIEHQANRVLTTAQLAEVYQTEAKNIQMNFTRNIDRFTEGKDYHLLTGAELKSFKDYTTDSGLVAQRSRSLYLWTDRGANRHSKILDTDKAWEQFDVLVETYFKVTNVIQLPDFGNPAIAARAWADQVEAKLLAESKVKTLAPKGDYYDALVERNLLTSIRDTAKQIGVKERKFTDWLKEHKYIYKDSKGRNKPFAEYIPLLFEMKEYQSSNGHSGVQTLITPKGRDAFRLRFEKVG